MINVPRNNDPWFHLCLLVTAQKRVMSIQYHILSLLKLNAFFWHLQLQCISIVWHPDASHLLYMKTNDGFSIEEVSGWCNDAVWKTLSWVYWPDHTPHLTFVWQTDCVENLILEECSQQSLVLTRQPALGVTHQICQQGRIFWSKWGDLQKVYQAVIQIVSC